MAYHTVLYLCFFLPAVLLLYQLMPRPGRRFLLLAAGYVFFWLISGKLLLYLLGATCITYLAGQLVARAERYRRLVFAVSVMALLSVLAYLKYYNFFAENVNRVFAAAALPKHTLLLPIGISFYTLQAIGYLADVYWKKLVPERHPGKLALFLAFFPQIMEGPIAMYSQTADALWEGAPIKEENLSAGAIRIFWGLFKKMIIADRLYVLVSAVFDSYEAYDGLVAAAAAIAYTVQLYMEFSGCMDIVIGSSRLFGIRLPENFRQPFAAKSAAEFWQRWHITLGVWFKTYVFYPVSMSKLAKRFNRFGKKHFGKHLTKVGVYAISLFPVWLCNGLWHGPQWNYLFYGMYYFVILLSEIAFEPAAAKLTTRFGIDTDSGVWNFLRLAKTWTIIFTGELFFRANGLRAGMHMFVSMFHRFRLQCLLDGTFLHFGLDLADYLAIGGGCLVVALVGALTEKKFLDTNALQKLRLPIRWALYYSLILAVVIFGAYGAGYQKVDLIYAGY